MHLQEAGIAVGARWQFRAFGDEGSVFLYDWAVPGGAERYCVAGTNSAGTEAHLLQRGDVSLARGDVRLRVEGAVAGELGVFFYGAATTQVPFGQGFLCVALPHYRLGAPVQIKAGGNASFAIDLTGPPAGSGPAALLPGSTWYFQCVYSDPAGGGAGFNATDGLRITFCR